MNMNGREEALLCAGGAMAAKEFLGDHVAEPVARGPFVLEPFEVLPGDGREPAALVFAPRHDGGADGPTGGRGVDPHDGFVGAVGLLLADAVLVPVQSFGHAPTSTAVRGSRARGFDMARTTDDRLDEDTALLLRHSELLVALNRQTEQLEAIVAQLRTLHEGIIRALSAATRLDALEGRIAVLERR
jgi:hypothetical protein